MIDAKGNVTFVKKELLVLGYTESEVNSLKPTGSIGNGGRGRPHRTFSVEDVMALTKAKHGRRKEAVAALVAKLSEDEG